MKTIIAGASGFIGQHLCSMLKSIGDEIITLSREDFITGKFDLLVHKLNIKKRFSIVAYRQQQNSLLQLTNSQFLRPYSYPRLLSAITRQMALILKMQKFTHLRS